MNGTMEELRAVAPKVQEFINGELAKLPNGEAVDKRMGEIYMAFIVTGIPPDAETNAALDLIASSQREEARLVQEGRQQ
jgi:class 3 adenylate cyclase